MPLELLSRIQFAFTISFHILYPAFSIGLITFIVIFETLWIKTGHVQYQAICKFWTKLLALTFGMGIVSGIVMEFQLGTNWSNFTNSAGNVVGVLFTYEVLTAFFIEAGFLGVVFFGWNRVGAKFHYMATLLALFGVTLSAFWILSANSWMQYPSGVVYQDGVFSVVSWFQAIFNPTFLPRFFHMLIATYIASLFMILAICAYYLLHKKFIIFSKLCFRASFFILLVLVPLQLLIGDTVGLNVHTYQPIKTAAIEGVWDTQQGAPLLLFAIPDQAAAKNLYTIAIPKGASLINTHSWDGTLVGLKSVPASDRPYVPFVFYSFRVMVGLWCVMMFTVLAGLALYFKKRLFDTKWFLKLCILLSPIGFVSIITGWFTAEFGRQPWVIYHFLRTTAAHSPIQLRNVVISLIAIIIVYGIIFGYFYFRYFFKIIKTGPDESLSESDKTFFYLMPDPNQSQ